MQELAIFAIVDAEESKPFYFWVNEGRVDNFCLIMPKSWDLMIRADRVNSRQYSLIGSLDPDNIIKEKQKISHFSFSNILHRKICLI